MEHWEQTGSCLEMAAEEGRQKEALPLRNAEVLIPEREWGWGGGWAELDSMSSSIALCLPLKLEIAISLASEESLGSSPCPPQP